MTTTMKNLKDAFAGESQTNRKYLAFAAKAERDGFANVARLFRTAAEAETIHALGKRSETVKPDSARGLASLARDRSRSCVADGFPFAGFLSATAIPAAAR